MTNFEKLSEYGDLMTVGDFVASVECGALINYDGFGRFATENSESDIYIKPSDIKKGVEIPDWATHVIWFNR